MEKIENRTKILGVWDSEKDKTSSHPWSGCTHRIARQRAPRCILARWKWSILWDARGWVAVNHYENHTMDIKKNPKNNKQSKTSARLQRQFAKKNSFSQAESKARACPRNRCAKRIWSIYRKQNNKTHKTTCKDGKALWQTDSCTVGKYNAFQTGKWEITRDFS